MNILSNKPVFELRINACGTSYLLRLNGVSVLKEYDSFSQITTTIPVNHWMRSGKNILTLVVMPDGEGERINSLKSFDRVVGETG